jgi:hypothetical protein
MDVQSGQKVSCFGKIMNGVGFNSFSMIFALDEIKQSELAYLKGRVEGHKAARNQ